MTSRQSSLIRYGSVSLIFLAKNCGEEADERSRLERRGRSDVFGWAVEVDIFALGSGLERENGGRSVQLRPERLPVLMSHGGVRMGENVPVEFTSHESAPRRRRVSSGAWDTVIMFVFASSVIRHLPDLICSLDAVARSRGVNEWGLFTFRAEFKTRMRLST